MGIEVELGFGGPIKCVIDGIKLCIDHGEGDRLLIFKGFYEPKTSKMNELIINKTMELVGMEPGVVLSDCLLKVMGGRRLYVKNISITNKYGLFSIEPNSALSISHCHLNVGSVGITIDDGAKLEILGCVVHGGSVGIKMLPTSKSVSVTQCLFTKNGQVRGQELPRLAPAETYGCIQIFDAYENVDEQSELVQLKCTDNTFEDNLCYPIVERINKNILNAKTYILENNVLRGYNGIYTRQSAEIKDA